MSLINTFTHLSGRNIITSNPIVRKKMYHNLGSGEVKKSSTNTSCLMCLTVSSVLELLADLLVIYSYIFSNTQLSLSLCCLTHSLPEVITPLEELTEANVHLHLSYPNSQVGEKLNHRQKGAVNCNALWAETQQFFHSPDMSTVIHLGTQGYYDDMNCKRVRNIRSSSDSS